MKEWVICPEYIVALLEYLEAEMERLYWNEYQEEYDSPFRNTGEHFDNGTFEVHAYDWSNEPKREYNFKCDDLEISWYKHLGRGSVMNKLWVPEEIIEILNKCMTSLGEEWHNGYYAN